MEKDLGSKATLALQTFCCERTVAGGQETNRVSGRSLVVPEFSPSKDWKENAN